MFQEERIKEILNFIQKEKRASVNELGKKFSVSKVTIRRDLDILLAKDLIIKTHGGAILTEKKLSYEIPYRAKSAINKTEKQKIGRVAAKLIKNDDIVILDSGSTTLEIAKRINQKNVTVVTNDINIATVVANNLNIELIVVGGVLIKGVFTLVSNDAIEFFKKTYVNKTFLGCDAIDLDYGISNRVLNECKMKLAMINAAQEVIVVCDKSKFGKKVSYHLCDISKIDKVIVGNISDVYLNAFKEKNIEVFLVK